MDALQIAIIIASVIFVVWTTSYIFYIIYQNKLIKEEATKGVILEIALEKDSEQNPFAIEQLWTSFHGLYLPWYKRIGKAQPYFSFEIKSENTNREKKKEITFNIWVPEEYKMFVKQKVLQIYPSAQIRQLKKEADYIPKEDDQFLTFETAVLGLQENSAFSIKTFQDFDKADPLSSVTAALTDLDNREVAVVQVLARPISYKWRRRAERILRRFEISGKKPNNLPEWTNVFSGFLTVIFWTVDGILNGLFGGRNPNIDAKGPQKGSIDSLRQKDMAQKTTKPPFAFEIRLLFATPYDKEHAKSRMRSMIASFNEFEGDNNGIKKEFIVRPELTFGKMKNRYFSIINNDDVLTTTELAGLCHLPNKNMFTPGLKKIQSKKKEAPVNLADENTFAVAEFREGSQRVGLDEKGRMRHIYVTGMTGVGDD